jgi:hypothetical protein
MEASAVSREDLVAFQREMNRMSRILDNAADMYEAVLAFETTVSDVSLFNDEQFIAYSKLLRVTQNARGPR